MALDPKWAPCHTCTCVDGEAGFEKWEIKGVLEPSRLCPRRLVSEDSNEWVALYGYYKSGYMAVGGGVLDQPRAFLEAMQIIHEQVSANG